MEKEEMLDGAESQNYGYGYGTKVRLFLKLKKIDAPESIL